MNTYITAATIKAIREAKGLTQTELAARIGVTDKAVSKWETGKGLPDVSLLEPLEAEEWDADHAATVTPVENEHFITIDHPMTKEHYISFVAYITGDRVQLVKFYPEGNAETRLSMRGHGILYAYCNRHGLMKRKF
jgi:transcriptional regulator with XRE-family HTH domain